jgi:DNA replication protein DnaC
VKCRRPAPLSRSSGLDLCSRSHSSGKCSSTVATIDFLAIALGIRACLAGHRVRFATATEWVARLSHAKRDGRLEDELATLGRVPLLIVDEVGYIPFDPHAANLMLALVSSRYERASMIVTSNKPFSRWGEIFGDDVVAAAMIDRLVHHAEILSLEGDSYRLKDKDLGSPPPAKSPEIG